MHGCILQAERFLFLSDVTEYWVTLHNMSKTEKLYTIVERNKDKKL